MSAAPAAGAMQRARGQGRLGLTATGLEELYQQGCIKLRLLRRAGALPEAVVINSSGGITGGDRLMLEARLGAGAGAVLTSQAAERVYRSPGGVGEVDNRLRLGPGARAHWLPQETILFDGAGLSRRLEVEMAADARLLAAEMLVFGRAAMGEAVTRLSLRDHWRIRRDGRLIWADSLRLDLPGAGAAGRATLAGRRAMATLVLVAPGAEAHLDRLRDILAQASGVEAGASAFNGLVLVRMIAENAHDLRKALMAALEQLGGLALPRVWML